MPASATSGLNSNGSTKDLPRAAKCTSPAAAMRPAPTSPPVRAWVVETGKPVRVARKMVRAAPSATASTKAGCVVTSSGTRPLPLKASTSPEARYNASSEPASVVTVAQISATR